MNVAVFASGQGSNLKAIFENQELNNLIDIKIVCSNNPDCNALHLARLVGIETYLIPKLTTEQSTLDLINKLNEIKIELIVLAGYLKLIPAQLIEKFEYKIINIHPALLPSFGGKGMYGINVHRAVFESSAKVSGATVHFVNQEYDKGLIIAQRCVDISDVKSPEEIAERVIKVEHQLLPFVIKKIAQKKIKILNNKVLILE